MRYRLKYAGLLLALTLLAVGCKHKKENNKQAKQEKQQAIKKRRADSLRIVQQRRDSLQQARADSLAKVKRKKKQEASGSLKSQGQYAIQVEAWRSKRKAQKREKIWKKRGFKDAYTIKHHGPTPGDIWYRVRLGYTDSRQKAERIQKQIQQKYQAKSWVQGSP